MQSIDLAIIGAGAAGLSAAQYAARAALKTVVFEQTGTGGQCVQIVGLENYPGFPDPISGEEFTERFERQAIEFGAEVRLEGVRAVRRDDRYFTVQTDSESYRASSVILATGAHHRELGVPGEREFQGRGVSYCATCDGPMFSGKRMLVVGGGDAACDEALFLAKLTDQVVLVHRRDEFRAQRSIAARVVEHDHIDVRLNTVVETIHGAPNSFGIDAVDRVVLKSTVDGSTVEEPFSAVFVFVGSTPRTELVPAAQRDETGYIVTDATMATSIPGLFAVGDVRNTPFRQLVVAAADGAIAAHAASTYIDTLSR